MRAGFFLIIIMPVFGCPYCLCLDAFCAPSEQLLERHIRLTHSQDPGFRIECKQTSCSRVFTNFRTYKNHLLTHRHQEDESNEESNDPMETNTGGSGGGQDSHFALVNGCDDDSSAFDNYCAKWILRTSETRKLTRATTVGIVSDVSELLLDVVTGIKTQVETCLRDNGLEPSAITGLDSIFSSQNHKVVPFSNLATFHHQLSYYKNHFYFIVSVFACTCIYIDTVLPQTVHLGAVPYCFRSITQYAEADKWSCSHSSETERVVLHSYHSDTQRHVKKYDRFKGGMILLMLIGHACSVNTS